MINKIRPYIQSFFKRADIPLLVICLICAFFGTAMVFKASSSMVAAGWEMDTNKQVLVQIVSIFLGTGVFVVLTIIDADLLGDQWRILVVFEVLLLVALVILGEDDGTGNKSWIRFAGIGIQPSEFIKIMYIVVSARQMTYLKEHEDINSLKSVVYMVAHLLAVFGGIFIVSSDLGSASIILMIFLAMFFALGVKLYWFALGGAAVASMIPLLWDHVLKG
ncbi:MAG: FtsW/RodA/SpoVE family cell cycle protein, partial [Oscillospiraceae bacterium]|nr:FtsW/RodA/SpoVE family cell cycle protein [Oscillospiraceae bacterium]